MLKRLDNGEVSHQNQLLGHDLNCLHLDFPLNCLQLDFPLNCLQFDFPLKRHEEKELAIDHKLQKSKLAIPDQRLSN